MAKLFIVTVDYPKWSDPSPDPAQAGATCTGLPFYSFAYSIPSHVKQKRTGFYATFLIWSSQSDELFATPSDVGGEDKELISSAG